jgi:hypothetical protein
MDGHSNDSSQDYVSSAAVAIAADDITVVTGVADGVDSDAVVDESPRQTSGVEAGNEMVAVTVATGSAIELQPTGKTLDTQTTASDEIGTRVKLVSQAFDVSSTNPTIHQRPPVENKFVRSCLFWSRRPFRWLILTVVEALI